MDLSSRTIARWHSLVIRFCHIATVTIDGTALIDVQNLIFEMCQREECLEVYRGLPMRVRNFIWVGATSIDANKVNNNQLSRHFLRRKRCYDWISEFD